MMKAAKIASIFVASALLASCTRVQHPASLSGTPRTTATVAATPLELGRALYARQEYALAIEKFSQAVREAPDSPDGYNALASAYDMIGRFDVSERYYEQALARAPSDGRIYRNMARSLRMQGRNGEALALLAEYDAISREKVAAASAVAQPPAPAVADEVPKAVASVAPVAPDQTTAALPTTTTLPLRQGRSITVDLADNAPVAAAAVPPPVQAPVARGQSVTVALDTPPPAIRRAAAAIRIMNGGGKRGLARGVQGWLAQAGWTQTRTGDMDRRFARSWIVHPRAFQADAIALAKRLPFPAGRIVDERASRVVLILGKNAASVNLQRARSRTAA